VNSGATLSDRLVIPIPIDEDIVALSLTLWVADAKRQKDWRAESVVVVDRV